MLNHIANKVRSVVKVLPFYLFTLLALLTSCSEDQVDVEEFANWQTVNESYFNGLYTTAKQKQNAGDPTWKVLRKYSLNESMAVNPEDYIVVEVLESGTGTESPLFSDSALVNYRGRLLPSASYSEGYVFDQTYVGDFNPATAVAAKIAVNYKVDGITTALQQMHVGDRWRIYVPSALGYGTSGSTGIPAYSTLIYDVRLVAFAHAGHSLPSFQ